jgi:hypothetical protein
MRALQSLVLSSLIIPLAACGLDRPIEPQPLVSVLDQWRAQVLEENAGSTLNGTPIEVENAEFHGDFGELAWNSAVMAEASGTESDEMIAVELLAGGGSQRWGMAIVGLYLPPVDSVVPGTRTRIGASEAIVIGCSGERLFFWDYDTSADISTVDVTVDESDPLLEHYTFSGEFEDGTTLSGRFDVRRNAPEASAP